MQHLSPGPVQVPMYFVEPHVKRGDYYLFINPITGRRMWVYPRMMGERRFPVVSALGTDEISGSQGSMSSLLSLINPQQLTQEINETRAEVARAQMYMKLAIGASIITSAVAMMALLTRE